MGLDDAVRSAVAAVNTQTASLQQDVTHEAWIGQDTYAKPQYATAVTRKALVQEGTSQVRTLTGEVITVRAAVSFLVPITPNGAAGRKEPIDPRDRITLPSGLTGPIVENPGAMVDPETGRPFIAVVWLR